MEEIQYLGALEEILVEHRAFGDSDYIHEQVEICYQRRLDKLSADVPVAGAVQDALCQADACDRRRILGDPAVRFAVNSALRQGETAIRRGLPLDECEEVFRATLQYLEKRKSGVTLEFGAKVNHLESGPYHGGVWSGDSGDLFGRVFRRAVKDRFEKKCEPGAELSTPTADHLAMLTKGLLLLNELVPSLTRSALSHVGLVALFPMAPWKGAASMSEIGLSGVIFLCEDLLQSPWWVAEHFLHEALHQKLYDFRHGHSLLVPNSAREDAPRICSPWNVPGANKSNYWDTHRAVAAFHVYVHLALLSTIAEERAPELEKVYGPLRHSKSGMMTNSRKAMERAHYLGEKIQELCPDELGPAGKRLIEWLISVLNALDDSPPPANSCVHLLLDRYRGEALRAGRRIESSLIETRSSTLQGEAPISSGVTQQLAKLAKREIESTRSVLFAVNAGVELGQFKNALDKYSDEELGTKFPQLRDLISKTILGLSQDGYRLKSASPESNATEEIVKQMIEESSGHLHRIFEPSSS
jgi:hypothetical protein